MSLGLDVAVDELKPYFLTIHIHQPLITSIFFQSFLFIALFTNFVLFYKLTQRL